MKQADRFNLEIAEFLAPIASQYPNRSEVSFVCIGTDRSTGDCFGPLVGTLLREQGWEHVIGTMEQPCDAYAVEQAVLMAENRAVVIAIDACLGKPQSVGTFLAMAGPLQPGAATGRRLPPVGHYSIAGVVNALSHKPYITIQTTSLYHVMRMAEQLAAAIAQAWPGSKRLLKWTEEERVYFG